MTTVVADALVSRKASERAVMKALVYQGPGKKSLEQRPTPRIAAPTDAIVRITKTTICGTDLHILKGEVPTCKPGRILGHEGVGVVDSVGAGVTTFRAGERVLISCISACGKCEYCRRGMYSHCTTGGWILGNEIDGSRRNTFAFAMPTQACTAYRKAPRRTPR
jgi:alcohol dehydrogenase